MMMQVMMSKATKRVEIRCTTITTGLWLTMEPTILSRWSDLDQLECPTSPKPIHYLEKTMNEAFIGSSTTEPFDPEKHDGLLFDSGATLNVCPKHYAEEIPIQPWPDTWNLRNANGQRLQTYGLRTVRYELTDRQRRVHLYVDYVACEADRPILSVVRLLESGWSTRLKGKQRLMVKDDVRIELTTHRGLLYVIRCTEYHQRRWRHRSISELCTTSTPRNRRLFTSARFNEPIRTTGDLKMVI